MSTKQAIGPWNWSELEAPAPTLHLKMLGQQVALPPDSLDMQL